jgi:hypothetical protein
MVDPASMLEGRTRETKIRRDAEGRWFNDGVELTHPLLKHAFDRWLRRAPDGSGRFCLSNDINWAFVTLEGPHCFVRSVRLAGGAVTLVLSNEQDVPLDPEALVQGPDGGLYCRVPGDLVARFDRHAMMQLDALIDEDDDGVFLRIGTDRVRPPVVADPLTSA